ncbi:MAG TPA: gliding motility-associated protein GldE [Flavipsychrobacter sp.]|nr:gliding motility-associated protein GldE [Flavipsychrobacter sp.]
MEEVAYGNNLLFAGSFAETIPVSNVTLFLIAILFLLLLTAIVSGAETAFFSLSAKDIDYLKTKNKQSSRQVIELLEQPKMLMATATVAKCFLNVAIIIATNFLVKHFLGSELNVWVSLLLQVLAVAFLLVLFGSVLPKVYAAQNSMRMALFAAPVMHLATSLFSSISRMVVSSDEFIEDKTHTTANFSDEDFEQVIEATVGHTTTLQEVNIFKGIIKFGNITVRQIMRTRLDVSGVPYGYNFLQVKRFATDNGYSRMPVYKDSLDTIVGIINSKDFLFHDDPNFDWHSLLRPVHYVHENKLIKDLRKEFQENRTHFAVVVDEFGGTSGIVTLEDIMEEIIGDIRDEFDEDELQFKKIDENNYIFEGKTLINDVCRSIQESPEVFDKVRGESNSLAGLLLEISGKFPAINEIINYKNFDFTVLEIDRMRIKRVKITIERVQDN